MDNVGFNSKEDSGCFIVQVLPLLLPADSRFLCFDFGTGVVPYGSYCILLVMISENGVSGASVPDGPSAPRALWLLAPAGCGGGGVELSGGPE